MRATMAPSREGMPHGGAHSTIPTNHTSRTRPSSTPATLYSKISLRKMILSRIGTSSQPGSSLAENQRRCKELLEKISTVKADDSGLSYHDLAVTYIKKFPKTNIKILEENACIHRNMAISKMLEIQPHRRALIRSNVAAARKEVESKIQLEREAPEEVYSGQRLHVPGVPSTWEHQADDGHIKPVSLQTKSYSSGSTERTEQRTVSGPRCLHLSRTIPGESANDMLILNSGALADFAVDNPASRSPRTLDSDVKRMAVLLKDALSTKAEQYKHPMTHETKLEFLFTILSGRSVEKLNTATATSPFASFLTIPSVEEANKFSKQRLAYYLSHFDVQNDLEAMLIWDARRELKAERIARERLKQVKFWNEIETRGYVVTDPKEHAFFSKKNSHKKVEKELVMIDLTVIECEYIWAMRFWERCVEEDW